MEWATFWQIVILMMLGTLCACVVIGVTKDKEKKR